MRENGMGGAEGDAIVAQRSSFLVAVQTEKNGFGEHKTEIVEKLENVQDGHGAQEDANR